MAKGYYAACLPSCLPARRSTEVNPDTYIHRRCSNAIKQETETETAKWTPSKILNRKGQVSKGYEAERKEILRTL